MMYILFFCFSQLLILFAIWLIRAEPMLTIGSINPVMWDDNWTVVTEDGSLSAQFEHTILITKDGAEILTQCWNCSSHASASYFYHQKPAVWDWLDSSLHVEMVVGGAERSFSPQWCLNRKDWGNHLLPYSVHSLLCDRFIDYPPCIAGGKKYKCTIVLRCWSFSNLCISRLNLVLIREI